jgi:NitT/TauT family transport system ATP-binding protein
MNPRLATNTQDPVILSADHISMSFSGAGGERLSVLQDVNFELRNGEIVALLGKSGSGKSTLLRLLAGLVAPTSGEARYQGVPLRVPSAAVAMVFQTFALLPWLTVRQNVELGLEARGIAPAERRARAERAIDLIGLDGFESAYPKELSGGMRQRVGFARALVVEPDALFMDEPFSALDVLTAENLRNELLSLWARDDFPTRAMLIVTHNIEEAVLLADRVLVLAANPGRITAEINVTLPRPRDRRSPGFEALVDDIYGIMTGREPAVEREAAIARADHPAPGRGTPTDTPLPEASVGGLAGLLEILVARGGEEDLPALAHDLNFEVDDLLPLVDGAVLLDFATVAQADLSVTEAGARFVTADILTSKELFATQAEQRAPLVRSILNALTASINGVIDEEFFLDTLRRGFSPDEARRQLDRAIDWGRYAELYDYDANTGELILEHREEKTDVPAR